MTRLALALNRFSERYVPSALVIAALLTVLVIAMAVGLARMPLSACVRAWGDGCWALLEFAMQMCLILMTGSILADSPVLKRALDAAARIPADTRQTIAFAAFCAMAFCWVHWGFGVIASAFLARSLIQRQPKTDYKLLVAVSYFGMGAVWHAGLSGSAPLLVATPKHFMQDKIGLIPLSETIFSPFNLALTVITVGALTLLAWILARDRSHLFLLPADRIQALADDGKKIEAPRYPSAWLRWLEGGWTINAALAALGFAWLVLDWQRGGLNITINKVNFGFLMLGLALHASPAAFSASAERAAGLVHGIVIQFPFYAGIFGVIKGAGLDGMLGQWFVSLADAKSFPLIVYWYSGILNYFVPSGGSKWAIEAPYILEASRELGVPYAKTVLAYAWGDMVTDMIQPFWCLPLLAVARLEFKDILGYTMIAFIVCAGIGSAAFWFL